MQTAISCMQLRGGSSKGLYFRASDLPADEHERNHLLLGVMEGVGPGDPRQIDGLGGAASLTSKIAIVSLAADSSADLDYLFIQDVIGAGRLSATQTCGNLLAGVLPFALEAGLLPATSPTTTARVRLLNTGGVCEVVVQTPGGQMEYAGTARIDGVPGTAAPILCHYLDTAGATCGALFPSGQPRDELDGVAVTFIDNGMPLVCLRASDVGVTGYESKTELDANEPLKARLEELRLLAGPLMHLGDVREQSIPKMCLLASPQQGGVVATRMFIPHVCHDAIGVLAAVSVATACAWPGTVAEGVASLSGTEPGSLSIEHPSGEMTVTLDYTRTGDTLTLRKSGVVRTARLLSRGEVFAP